MLAAPKQRLDQLVAGLGLADSRSRARALIEQGFVRVNDQVVSKPGATIAADATIAVSGDYCPWVSRGGLKLAHALEVFGLSPENAVAIDIGASTGGFTQVLLHHGAARVYAVDAGHGQLSPSLRDDPRVVVLEKTNARYLRQSDVPETPEWIVCDASFISLSTVLPAALSLARPAARLVALVKPQFEAGPARVGKGGVVREAGVRQAVCREVQEWLESVGWPVDGLVESPITGPDGNKEYLVSAHRSP